ncbi:RelA/SpoT family protein [Elusimicrobiota bacterium]
MIDINILLDLFKSYEPDKDANLIERAYDYAKNAHESQLRKSEEPYLIHCIETAKTLLELKLDLNSICAGLLHDVVEDTKATHKDLVKEFNRDIANLVEGVTKLERFKFSDPDLYQAENWRKMLLSSAKDIRVILIKLADRLHNMRTINYLPLESRQRIAKETLNLYAPIADRLGMFTIKSDLEDISFQILDEEIYLAILKKLDENASQRDECLQTMESILRQKLDKYEGTLTFTHRPKHIYSIYQKMLRQNKTVEEIEDVMALRIIADTISSCYVILGEVHASFKPVPGSFTDYIAQPKINMYQSLHTTVYGPEDNIYEIQVRTDEMHKRCEYGIAAHWKYKMGTSPSHKDKELEAKLSWIAETLTWLKDLKNPGEFLDSLKTELRVHQIFIFTPRREVKALAEGATPIDFAYAIHTEVGNRAIGAKVNNKMVKLNFELKNGDTCEIVTRKNAKPNKDWLAFVKTARARSKIRRVLSGPRKG